MAKYLIQMNDDYKKKNYPNGFLAGASKNTKNAGIILYVLAAFLFIVFTPLTIAGLWFVIQGMMKGDKTETTGGLVFCVIGLVFVLPAILFLLLGTKYLRRDQGKLLEIWARDNNYSEQVIREYTNQVLNNDTYIMHIAGEFEAKSNVGVGFLTRDFIAIHGVVMKRKDLIAVCLVNTTDTIGVGNKIKPVKVLKIAFLSKDGRCVMSPVKKEAAKELTDMLIKQTPDIDTRMGNILTEKELEEFIQENISDVH